MCDGPSSHPVHAVHVSDACIGSAITHPSLLNSAILVDAAKDRAGSSCDEHKAQKATMQTLDSIGHNAADRLAAMDLAQAYGQKLYTGVFFRHPEPAPTFGQLARERHDALRPTVKARGDVLNVFKLKK